MIDFYKKNKKVINWVVIGLAILFLILPIATRKYIYRDYGATKNGYVDAKMVARYIIKYHELPKNYGTKDLLVRYRKNHPNCDFIQDIVGGDSFYNNGLLKEYDIKRNVGLKECDIYDAGYRYNYGKRGTFRLVYTTNVKHPRVFFAIEKD